MKMSETNARRDIEAYIAALQGLVSEKENKQEKTPEKVVEMLVTAMADEFLAAYQYWVCKNLIRGNGRSDAIPEYDQHYKDELEHADEIMLRIKELGGTPIFDPADWAEKANPWTEVSTTDACEQLDITIKAEQDAIDYYNKIIDYCKGTDEITMRLCRSILADEAEHLYDLQMLKEEICG